MEIEVEGFPQPTVQVTNNGKDVTAESNVKISSSSIGKSLEKVVVEVKEIKLSQAGNYSIKATNDLSQTSEYWSCTVKSKPVVVKHFESEYNRITQTAAPMNSYRLDIKNCRWVIRYFGVT